VSVLDGQHKTLSIIYDMDQIRNSVNARFLPGSNTLYRLSTLWMFKGVEERYCRYKKDRRSNYIPKICSGTSDL